MNEQAVPESATPAPGPMIAIIVVVALIPLIGALMFLATQIGVIDFLFAGFLFILYWAGIKAMAPHEFAPALVGSLGGLGMAYLLHALPLMFGIAGAVVAGLAVALSIYLIVRQQVPMLINNAFMLLLTVGTSFAFAADLHFGAAAAAILLAAAYTGGLVLIGRAVASRNSKATASAPMG